MSRSEAGSGLNPFDRADISPEEIGRGVEQLARIAFLGRMVDSALVRDASPVDVILPNGEEVVVNSQMMAALKWVA